RDARVPGRAAVDLLEQRALEASVLVGRARLRAARRAAQPGEQVPRSRRRRVGSPEQREERTHRLPERPLAVGEAGPEPGEAWAPARRERERVAVRERREPGALG